MFKQFLIAVTPAVYELVRKKATYRELCVGVIFAAVSQVDGHPGFRGFSKSKFFGGLLDAIFTYGMSGPADEAVSWF